MGSLSLQRYMFCETTSEVFSLYFLCTYSPLRMCVGCLSVRLLNSLFPYFLGLLCFHRSFFCTSGMRLPGQPPRKQIRDIRHREVPQRVSHRRWHPRRDGVACGACSVPVVPVV